MEDGNGNCRLGGLLVYGLGIRAEKRLVNWLAKFPDGMKTFSGR